MGRVQAVHHSKVKTQIVILKTLISSSVCMQKRSSGFSFNLTMRLFHFVSHKIFDTQGADQAYRGSRNSRYTPLPILDAPCLADNLCACEEVCSPGRIRQSQKLVRDLLPYFWHLSKNSSILISLTPSSNYIT